MRVIPQRELRNDIGRILRDVAAGQRYRVTVGGQPVAELVPLEGRRRTFVSRDRLMTILEQAPLDRDFMRDVDDAIGMTGDEL
jgi:prevent-host-death family protein